MKLREFERFHVALGIVLTVRDFWHWHQGLFVVPWYRCPVPLLAAALIIAFMRWKAHGQR